MESVKKFEVGRKYKTRLGNGYTITKRTAKTVSIVDDFGNVKRCKVYADKISEFVYPEGRYSMAPVLHA